MAGAGRAGGASNLGEALVFLGFVCLGAGFIVFAKLSGLPAMLVTGVPVLVMLVYAAGILLVRSLAVAEDQGGDNLYYMGFLFTLTSLAVSLWQFDADGAAEEIVRNFGVAVASTIAGIALRIFMTQLARDPAATERQARGDLADAARRVRRELDAVVLDLAHFRRGTQQAAAESWTSVREEVAETARSIGEEMRAAALPMAEAARTSAEDLAGLTQRVDALAAALDRLAGRLDAAAPGATVTPFKPATEAGETRRPVVVPEIRDGRP
jgi:hypothetical protein